jgi:hypothetical protein
VETFAKGAHAILAFEAVLKRFDLETKKKLRSAPWNMIRFSERVTLKPKRGEHDPIRSNSIMI